VGGARFDYAQDNGSLNELTGVRAAARARNNWVYKAGAVFKPFGNHDGIALFYNYAETFTAQAGTNLAGVPYKDISGVANEIGVKFDLPKQGLVMTASVFENKNTNFPIRVLNPALGVDEFFQIGTGVSKGWEADISWQPNPRISFLFALSDVDSKNPNGLRKRNVQNGFNYRVVGKYKLSQQISAGAALIDIADRAGDNNNTFVTKGYQTVDLFFTYGVRQWKAQLNLTNLLDGDGVESDIVASLAQVQSPRSVRVSLQYTF
jgi:iron complex outermembrane receptor protein